MDHLETIETGHGRLYIKDDYTYTRSLNGVHRCSKRVSKSCSAALFEAGPEQLVEGNTGDEGIAGHSHDPEPYLARRQTLIQNMLHEARTTLTPLYDIFRNQSLT